jgi:two-component system nitrate/nitrite response regulator NarL
MLMQATNRAATTPLRRPEINDRYRVNQVDVVLIGGDRLFREGLRWLFAGSPVSIVGESATIEEAVADHAAPDVAILLDGPIGGLALDGLRRGWPKSRAVVLASRTQAGALADAVEAGVDGYLLKDMEPAALVQAIVLVRMGGNVFPTAMATDLMRATERTDRRDARLTPREIDILHGLLEGHANKVIANRLGTTDATVKAQLRHLLRKIGAENRTQAALWAREHGIVRPN